MGQIEINDDAYALIFNADHTLEIVSPDMEDDEQVGEYAMVVVAIAELLHDINPTFNNLINEKIKYLLETMEEYEKEETQ